MAEGVPERRLIDGAAILRFAPHIRFQFDKTRERWVVQAPERLFVPDETAAMILQLVDGARPVDAIIDELAAKFSGAPREVIAKDVLVLLQDLADKGVLRP
jgi:pyrroloquinoline quinone biosynthesis protein D